MVTTIQVDENTKDKINNSRKDKQTYDQLILNLLESSEHAKSEREKALIEECEEMKEEYSKINNEFESTLMDGLDKSQKFAKIA